MTSRLLLIRLREKNFLRSNTVYTKFMLFNDFKFNFLSLTMMAVAQFRYAKSYFLFKEYVGFMHFPSKYFLLALLFKQYLVKQ